jgi:hypothetical protein
MLDLDELISSVQELLTALVKVKATIASSSSNPSYPSTSKHGSSLRKKPQPQEEVKTIILQALEYIQSEVLRLRTIFNLEALKQVVEENTSHDKLQKPSNDNSIDYHNQETSEKILTSNIDQNHPDRNIEIQNSKGAAIPTSNVDEKQTDRDVEIPTDRTGRTGSTDRGIQILTSNAAVKTLDRGVEIATSNVDEKQADEGVEILTSRTGSTDRGIEIPTSNVDEKHTDTDVEIPTSKAAEKNPDRGVGIPTDNAAKKTLDRGVEITTSNAEKTPDRGGEEKHTDIDVEIPTSNADEKNPDRGIRIPTSSANEHLNIIQLLYQKDIDTLNNSQMLNDKVINIYICFLKTKSKINIYFVLIYFFSNLVSKNLSSIDFKAVSR